MISYSVNIGICFNLTFNKHKMTYVLMITNAILVSLTRIYASGIEYYDINNNHLINSNNLVQNDDPYVTPHPARTFYKYHHRRKSRYEDDDRRNSHEETDHVISKRNNLRTLLAAYDHISSDRRLYKKKKRHLEPNIPFYDADATKLPTNFTEQTEISNEKLNSILSSVKGKNLDKVKIKAAIKIPKTIPSTSSVPRRVCVYKYQSVALSERSHLVDATNNPASTNDYDDTFDDQDYDEDAQSLPFIVHDGDNTTHEVCSPSTPYCYTLWMQTDNNITILGQGCWKAVFRDSAGCGSSTCMQEPWAPTAKSMAAARFCCCSDHRCNERPVAVSYAEEASPSRARGGSTVDVEGARWGAAAGCLLLAALTAALLATAALCRRRCATPPAHADDTTLATHKGAEHMEDGADVLATGLLCVDNLKLMEHIGSGRFGSVWRGALGSRSVAVKLYSGPQHWTREVSLYTLPHMHHANLLRYFGSDTRAAQTQAGRQHLLVLELARGSLREHLAAHCLSWSTFAHMAHGLAAAVAHLHTHIERNGSYKPCVVHRDINSSNVLLRSDNSVCLADLGLALALPHRQRQDQATSPPAIAAHRITEAGTLRYLAPEALEGALDLRCAAAALRAVDVFALGLVLWEMLWRVAAAHGAPSAAPAAALPYAHCGLADRPSLEQMQTAVSRRKVRPPLPRGPPGPVPPGSSLAAEVRALRLASDTCEECWDHDAEARLTAVCVEERLLELQQMLRVYAPPRHSTNQLNHRTTDVVSATPSPPENDKNLNCLSANVANQNRICDQRTPLLFPQPHQGRNPCLERNLVIVTEQDATEVLIDKSLKDSVNSYGSNGFNNGENARNDSQNEPCLSVARNQSHNRIYQTSVLNHDMVDRFPNESIRHRPLASNIDYVQNDVSILEDHSESIAKMPIKQTNLIQEIRIEKPKWGLRRLFSKKDSKVQSPLETEVKLVANGTVNNTQSTNNIRTSVVKSDLQKPVNNDHEHRPSNLNISGEQLSSGAGNSWGCNAPYDFESPCTLSPPNQTLSPTMMLESELNKSENKVFGFKELLLTKKLDDTENNKAPGQIFAVIVPKAKYSENNMELDSKVIDINGIQETSDKNSSISKPSVKSSISAQTLNHSSASCSSESDDSIPKKKRVSCDDKIYSLNSDEKSRLSQNSSLDLEMKYISIENTNGEIIPSSEYVNNEFENHHPFDLNSDCSTSSDEEHLMLLSENGASKITMQCLPSKTENSEAKKRNKDPVKDQNNITKIATDGFSNFCHKYVPKTRYANFDNENSGDNTGEFISGDNPVYLAAMNGEIDTANFNRNDHTLKVITKRRSKSDSSDTTLSPKNAPNHLSIKKNLSRQHSLEYVSEIFTSSGDLSHLRNPADRVKTPGDVPPSVRRIRRDRVLQKGRSADGSNRLSLYDDRMMFGNSL